MFQSYKNRPTDLHTILIDQFQYDGNIGGRWVNGLVDQLVNDGR